jgi:pimeloyl-ACP methyl ester carboxylesterase
MEIQAELLHEYLPDLDIPTLILQGRQDSLEVINHAQTYANHSPNTKLQMIDQAGNDIAQTVPGIVAQHIDYFVKYQT